MSRIYLNGLCCDKTTEQGEDEVYILVAGIHSNGTQYNYRLPGDNNHWDMNDDSSNKHCIYNINLASFDLQEGENVQFVFMIMEEDGGTSAPYTTMIATLLSQVPNPIAVAAGTVIGFLGSILTLHDSDDYIGSCAVQVTKVAGHLSTNFRAIDRVSGQILSIHGPNTCEFRMNGDGSNYVGWYHVD